MKVRISKSSHNRGPSLPAYSSKEIFIEEGVDKGQEISGLHQTKGQHFESPPRRQRILLRMFLL